MIDKKVAIVTGASRGIGNAIALQMALDGFSVAAVGTSAEENITSNLNKIRDAGQPFIYIKGDISSEKDRRNIVDNTISKFGRIDVLVNNAGVAPKVRMDILETTEESMNYVMDINLKGTFFLTQTVANIMLKETKELKGFSPKIINISSISAYTSSTQRAEYCIAKSGISMVTTLFADRLAEYDINVYEVRPGIIYTDMTSGVREKYQDLINNGLTPLKRWGQPQDIADAVSVLCSGKLNFSTGEVINVDGGFHIRRL